MSGGQSCLVPTRRRSRRYARVVRAFTLLEVMVVVVIVGILSAAGAPSIVHMLDASAAQRSLVESVSTVAVARDSARGFGTCLEYTMRPAPPAKGPYTFEVVAVSCPGDSGPVVRTPIGAPQAMSPKLTQILVRPVIGGVLRDPIDTIRFDRSGGLYDPTAELRVDGVYGGEQRRFTIFPAAGTISVEERP